MRREFNLSRTCPFKVVPWLSILADLSLWSSEPPGLPEVVPRFFSFSRWYSFFVVIQPRKTRRTQCEMYSVILYGCCISVNIGKLRDSWVVLVQNVYVLIYSSREWSWSFTINRRESSRANLCEYRSEVLSKRFVVIANCVTPRNQLFWTSFDTFLRDRRTHNKIECRLGTSRFEAQGNNEITLCNDSKL